MNLQVHIVLVDADSEQVLTKGIAHLSTADLAGGAKDIDTLVNKVWEDVFAVIPVQGRA